MNFKILKPYLVLSFFIFFISVILGTIAAKNDPSIVQKNFEVFIEKFGHLKEANPLTIFLFIFINNTLVDFLSLITFFTLGLGTFFILFSNGFLIGVFFHFFSQQQSWFKILLALIPHGIVEIPSFLLSSALSFWLTIQFLKRLKKKKKFFPAFKYAFRFFLKVVISLNFLAAFIETFITPLIYSFFQ